MSVDRAIALGNRLLADCRAHLRKHAGKPEINSDPLFALSYVMAEFIAASSATEAEIDEGIRLNSEIMAGRAREALPDVIARRKRRAN